ncbi:hypothetical protein MM221_18925 [Salipaludibacillus sp. LMS25]|uniref:hypothetical protein n=1 Tax=Salipaludibacillus sp. LMS25 TaxID=2924031 RepID=UPI0020D14B34|nr:hypothetical protein [Salipaludibacillus sp. LMS25]UTR14602.1 hypothetical protein MM221_18925 [Salipaludibacillus sp. LMS25]
MSQIKPNKKNEDNIKNQMGEGEPHPPTHEFPPRSTVHKKVSRPSSRAAKRKKRKKFRIPLVTIWLVLFFLIVGLVLTYPFWITRL